MNNSKKILAVAVVAIVVVAAILPLLCINNLDARTERQVAIDEYIDSIDYDPKTAIYSSGEHVEYKAAEMEESGSQVIVTKYDVCKAGTEAGSDVIANADANSVYVYPGALIRADSNLANGSPNYIETKDRSNIKLSTNLDLGGKDTPTVNPQTYQNVKSGIDQTIETWAALGYSTGATSSYSVETAYSQSQVGVELDINLDVLEGIGIGPSYEQTTDEQTVVIKCTQVYYTFGFNTVDGQSTSGYIYPSEYFGPKTTVDDVKHMLNDQPAVYVASVTYGKTVFISGTTKNVTENFELALSIAVSCVDGKLTTGQSEMLKNANYYMTVMGGASNCTNEAATYDQVIAELTEAPTVDDYRCAAIISAQMNYLDSGDLAYSYVSTEYLKKTSTVLDTITFKIHNYGIYDVQVDIHYCTFTGVDEEGNFTGVNEDACTSTGRIRNNGDYNTTITAKHTSPFWVSAWIVDGGHNFLENYYFDDPIESIEFYCGGYLTDSDFQFYVDGEKIAYA